MVEIRESDSSQGFQMQQYAVDNETQNSNYLFMNSQLPDSNFPMVNEYEYKQQRYAAQKSRDMSDVIYG